MFKKWLALSLLCLTLLCILAACGDAPSSSSSTGSTSGNTVHMDTTNFTQQSITIKKGQSISLVSDTSVPHIIANGTWKNGSPATEKEPGAPTADNLQINGNATQSIGPFNTAGTFQLYCTLHPGMNLTIVVQ